MVQLFSVDEIDEIAALKQLESVLAIEKLQRQLHLQVMIRLRNEFSTEQRKIAFQIKSTTHSRTMQQRLTLKFFRIQKILVTCAKFGQQSDKVHDSMQQFSKLMEVGKHQEAEQLLDLIMKGLGLNQEPTDAFPGGDPALGMRDPIGLPGTKIARLSPEVVHFQVQEMKKGDVAWRKIAWKTCLLESLRAARDQKKPVML